MSAKPKTHEQIDQEFERLLVRLRAYRPSADFDLLRRAYTFAAQVHLTQLRQSGEPYIAHPVAACHILADVEADEIAMAAAMLHDTIEDCAQDEEREIKASQVLHDELRAAGKKGQADKLQTQITTQRQFNERLKDELSHELRESFGETIFELVEGVTRMSAVRLVNLGGPEEVGGIDEARRVQAENLRRMVMAASRDPRVLIVKLADRLHNMQTLYAKRRPKQLKIARETEVIYAKLAGWLGVWRIKWEMEDLALRYLRPEAYAEIERRVARTRDERMVEIHAVVDRIKDAATKAGLTVEVQGRPKHIYSIYQKMLRQGVDFDEIYDLEAIRVICDTSPQCYMMLGIVHNLWPHQQEHFNDYISHAKPNGYQSIHTKVIVPGHGPMEVQIRTWDMHRHAEYGVAAHWRYKADGEVNEVMAERITQMRLRLETLMRADETDESDGDFLSEFEATLDEDDIFVTTPKGDVIGLPRGATVVDFAYRIHTEVGHTCVGARVGRRIVPLSYQLQNGETVEILCRENTGPSRDWLRWVQTSSARARIRAYLRRHERATLVETGSALLADEARRQKCDYKDLLRRDHALPAAQRRRSTDQPVEDVLMRVAHRRGYPNSEQMLSAIGEHLVSAEQIFNLIRDDIEQAEIAAGLADEPDAITVRPSRETNQQGQLSVSGASNVLFRRAKCCQPLPGDDIVGYITRTTGIAIHRTDCPNLPHWRNREPERVIEVNWSDAEHSLYHVPLEVRAHDRVGLLRDLTGLMSEVGVNITEANTISAPIASSAGQSTALVRLQLEFMNRHQLDELVRRLPGLGVFKISLRGEVYYDAEKSSSPVPRRPRGAGPTDPAGH
ncbi:MAG TPA: (p)ppGpp synthetase [Armatimonadetes bacterium]|nr:(p)ppGpp synthetase [Armatimonadota bacterium]